MMEASVPETYRQVRILTLPMNRQWRRLQAIYARQEDDSDTRTRARRCVYRNALISTMGQAQLQASSRGLMLESLLECVDDTKSFDGLESPFLSLMSAAFLMQRRELFETGIELWKQHHSPKAAGTAPVRLYDFEARTVTYFQPETYRSLFPDSRNSDVLAWDPELAGNLTRLGAFTIGKAFDPTPGPPVMHTMSESLTPQEKKRAERAAAREATQWHVVGGVFIIYGSFIALIPGGQIVGGVIAIVGAGMAIVPDLKDSYRPTPDDEGETSTIDPPADVPDQEADDGVLADAGGDDLGETGGIENEGDGGGEDGGGEGGCFAAGTPVRADGNRITSIDKLQINDLVLARDAEGKTVARKVRKLFTHANEETVIVSLSDGSELITTNAHRMWVAGRGFVSVSSFHRGDALTTWDGRAPTVEHVRPSTARAVYNLSVDEDHTYFVGSNGVLVHNLKIAGPEDFS
jgi:hypothetical protein